MMEANLDQTSDYAFDVFNGIGELEHQQADFRALVCLQSGWQNASVFGREMIALAWAVSPPDIGGIIGPYAVIYYSQWTEMMLRWAEDFLAKLRRLASTEAKTIIGVSHAVRGAVV